MYDNNDMNIDDSKLRKVKVFELLHYGNNKLQQKNILACNNPDTTLRDAQRTCLLFDVCVPTERNEVKKEAQKVLQYKLT
jgi:hypothetical protein